MKKFKLRKKDSDKPKKKRRLKGILLGLFMILGIGASVSVLLFGAYIVVTAPDFTKSKLYSTVPTVLLDKNGEEFARIGQENRVLTTYDDLPEVFIDAIIATEDSRFFQHNGLDAARFLKASMGQAMGKDAGGASTITMQVAKNTYSKKSATEDAESEGIAGIIRKFKDIYMSIFKIEKAYTKEEIIEFYVNSQWFQGGATNYSGIYGVEQGSQSLFGKSIKDLSLPEASLLAGMFNNPARFDPIKHPERAKTRQKTVLDLMYKHGYITEEEAKDAASIPIESLLKVKTNETSTVNKGYQAFIDFVLQDVEEKTGSNPSIVPMTIYTTLDRSVQDVLVALENGDLYKFADNKVQNGIAITSTVDGSVVALGPGRDYVAKGLNRSTIRKQPGSTAKPLLDYGPWVEYGNASPANLLFDEPYNYSNGTSLKNWDGQFKGLITFRDALIDSRNIPALQAFQATSEEQKAEFTKNLGIDLCEYSNGKAVNCELFESKSIGGWDGISPLESSAAYAAFARGGYYIEPYSFTKIVYTEDEKEVPYKYTKTKVMSEDTAFIITDVLMQATKDNIAGRINVANTDIASKTGTTTIDAETAKKQGIPTYATPNHWVNTYSPDYSISVWYGYDKNTDGYLTSNSGTSARKAIMSTIANKIYKPNAKFNKPSSVVEAVVEFGTVPLKLASEFTPDNLKKTDLFKQGTEPTDVSTRFSKLENPTNGNILINGSSITLTWDAIKLPDAIDTNSLQTYFNENYKGWSEKYYQERIAYNNGNIGTIGYQVYLKNSDGTLISLGYTNKTSFTYVATSASDTQFVVKSAYSIFKNNMSSGLEIGTNTSITDNTTLQNLTPNTGTLSPTFNKNKLEYTLTVSNTINEITFTAVPSDNTSTVNGTTCDISSNNICKIIVTSTDNRTKTYTINIKKE